jgi:dynein heavy chain, axonemal
VLFESWYEAIPANILTNTKILKKIKGLKAIFVETLIRELRINLKEVVATMDNNICQSFMRILDSYFIDFTETEIKKINPEEMAILEDSIENLCIFALIWSFCCTTNSEGRVRFNTVVRKLIKDNLSHIKFPEEGTIYNYRYDMEEKQYVLWEESNKNFTVDAKAQYHEIMIPTGDSARNIYFLKLLVCNEKHVLNCGPTGTGKSLNINQLLTKELGDEYQYIAMVFSAQSGCNQTQDTIDGKLDKLRKGVYGPPIGKKCIIFVDDMNMPKKEEFGAQPPIELIRQYLDHKGWYNRKDLLWMKIERLVMLAAMGPPGGGRTFITNRVIRHFNVIAYTDLDKDTINTIFTQLMGNFYRKFSESVRSVQPQLIETVIKVYDKVREELLPTPSKSHYTFNLRDIWRVFQGLCSGSPKYITEVKDLLRLWYHENMRVFHDRLTTVEDRSYLKNMLVGFFTEFGYESDEVVNVERILFGDFTQNRESDIKPYIQIDDLPGLVNKMDQFQEEYNNEINFIINGPKKAMKLVMFLDAAEHITRIARIIRQPQGNALILGVGGSGRQSLSRIATYLTGYKLFQIEVNKSYNMRVWREDIKKVLLLAGLENKPVSFLFCDTQIINEQMLEDINNILNSGDVTGIYQ